MGHCERVAAKLTAGEGATTDDLFACVDEMVSEALSDLERIEAHAATVARFYDVPPWRKPRFARLRWGIHRIWSVKAIGS